MRIGVFADIHDHVDNLRHAVAEFNRRQCELVIFAGDFVSTMVLPPLRELNCRVMACFGDNEGNKLGLQAGFRILGTLGEPPFCFCTPDGTRVLVTHQFELLKGDYEGAQLVVFAHTHRPLVQTDEAGRLFVNPGETSGWTYREPSLAIVETNPLAAEIIRLPEMPPMPPRRINRSGKFR